MVLNPLRSQLLLLAPGLSSTGSFDGHPCTSLMLLHVGKREKFHESIQPALGYEDMFLETLAKLRTAGRL